MHACMHGWIVSVWNSVAILFKESFIIYVIIYKLKIWLLIFHNEYYCSFLYGLFLLQFHNNTMMMILD